MLNSFKVKRHLKMKKNQTERLFVEHFFGDADLCLGTKARKRGEFCLFNPKTINARYICFIMKSPPFMKELYNFINFKFKDDYNLTRESKLTTVLEKCYEFIAEDDGKRKVVAYLEGNKKCKLPWSSMELDKAIKSVLTLLENRR